MAEFTESELAEFNEMRKAIGRPALTMQQLVDAAEAHRNKGFEELEEGGYADPTHTFGHFVKEL